eukprot:CAMPEP_0174259098 /NCGR_PEP_ID=MMETSP0439-20130205/7983_1 /TAXON_ID=0 /ORGANISM="Stereomyxa ramosa, Strain Chinc5" /LENGTH=2118 /DNA_ID=CAMNT_0015342867 /DNA_START=80 /DNA_END=6436 /DNA_ORIENTATION=+
MNAILLKRTAKSLLHKFFGEFLKEKIQPEQLDFKGGTLNLKDLHLNTETINNRLKALPFSIKTGHISRAFVSLQSQSFFPSFDKIVLEGVNISIVPKAIGGDNQSENNAFGESRFEFGSMYDVDYVSGDEEGEEGLKGERELNLIINELLSMLEKIYVKDLTIEIEFFSQSRQENVVAILAIPSLEYADIHQSEVSPVTVKSVQLSKLELQLCYAQGKKETVMSLGNLCPENQEEGSAADDLCERVADFRFKLRKNERDTSVPKIETECTLPNMKVVTTPQQLKMLVELFSEFDVSGGDNGEQSKGGLVSTLYDTLPPSYRRAQKDVDAYAEFATPSYSSDGSSDEEVFYDTVVDKDDEMIMQQRGLMGDSVFYGMEKEEVWSGKKKDDAKSQEFKLALNMTEGSFTLVYDANCDTTCAFKCKHNILSGCKYQGSIDLGNDFHSHLTSQHLTCELKELALHLEQSNSSKVEILVESLDVFEYLYKFIDKSSPANIKGGEDMMGSPFTKEHVIRFFSQTTNGGFQLSDSAVLSGSISPAQSDVEEENPSPRSESDDDVQEYGEIEHNPSVKCEITKTRGGELGLTSDSFLGNTTNIDLQLQNMCIEYDLGLGDRLEQFFKTFSEAKAPNTEENGAPTSLLSSRNVKGKDDIQKSLASIAKQKRITHSFNHELASSTCITVGVKSMLYLVVKIPDSEKPVNVKGENKPQTSALHQEKLVFTLIDHRGPKAVANIQSDQTEVTWSVEFEQIMATIHRGPLVGNDPTQFLSEPTFFEAQMRDTQNEVVTPLEITIKSDDWSNSYSQLYRSDLSSMIEDDDYTKHATFSDFFSVFEGRGGYDFAEAEAISTSRFVVIVKFPSSHLDICKSDYDLLSRLLSSMGKHNQQEDSVKNENITNESSEGSLSCTDLDNSSGQTEDYLLDSSDGGYHVGSSPQNNFAIRQEAVRSLFVVKLFFTQGNWVFREDGSIEPQVLVDSKESTSTPHRFELEFSKLHLFYIANYHGKGLNYFVTTAQDLTIHDTISYNDTAPVAQKTSSQQNRRHWVLRALFSSSKEETVSKITFQDVTLFHKRGSNWLLQLFEFFTLSEERESTKGDKVEVLQHSTKSKGKERLIEEEDIFDEVDDIDEIDKVIERLQQLKRTKMKEKESPKGKEKIDELDTKTANSKKKFSLTIEFINLEVQYLPTILASKAILSIENLTVSTGANEDVDKQLYNIYLNDCRVYIIADTRFITQNISSYVAYFGDREGSSYRGQQWEKRGFVKVAMLDFIDISVVKNSEPFTQKKPPLEILIQSEKIPTFEMDACTDSFQVLVDILSEYMVPDDTLFGDNDTPSDPKFVSELLTQKGTIWEHVDPDAFATSETFAYENKLQPVKKPDVGKKKENLSRFIVYDNYKDVPKEPQKRPTNINSNGSMIPVVHDYLGESLDGSSSGELKVQWGPGESPLGLENEHNGGMVEEQPRGEKYSPGGYVVFCQPLEGKGSIQLPVKPTRVSARSTQNSQKQSLPKKTRVKKEVVSKVKWLVDEHDLNGFKMDNFFRPPPTDGAQNLEIPDAYPQSLRRIIGHLDVVIRFYDGEDWAMCPSATPSPASSIERGDSFSPSFGDCISPFPMFVKTRSTRTDALHMEIFLKGIKFQMDNVSEGTQYVQRFALGIKDIEIQDHITSSELNKFMCYDLDSPREIGMSMFYVEMECVRPDPKILENEEWRMKVNILPLRFYIDQDALEFMVKFFSATEPSPLIPETEPMYFQSCVIKSVMMKIDYHPKRMDYNALYGDNKISFLAKALPLRAATVHLKPIKVKARGIGELLSRRIIEAYRPHLKETQIYELLYSIAPIRSLLNVGSGVSDLIYTPLKYWNTDGSSVLTGIQQGTASAAQKITMETLNATSTVTSGVQHILQSIDYYLGGESESINPNTNQPQCATEGLTQAYESVSREMENVAHRLVAVPWEEYEKHGTTGYLSSLVSGVPVAVLRPMIGVAEGVTKTLMGVSKWVDPELQKEMMTKFKSQNTTMAYGRTRPQQVPNRGQGRRSIPNSPVGSMEEEYNQSIGTEFVHPLRRYDSFDSGSEGQQFQPRQYQEQQEQIEREQEFVEEEEEEPYTREEEESDSENKPFEEMLEKAQSLQN